jgi:hypothetical protein
MIVSDSLHSSLDYECLISYCDWLGSDLRIGHFFSFRCPLVNTPQAEHSNLLRVRIIDSLMNEISSTEISNEGSLTTESESESYVTTDGQSASLSWNKGTIWSLRPDFITVRQMWIYWCGALSLTRGRVCRLKLLMALTSAVILESESRETRDHTILSQIRDSQGYGWGIWWNISHHVLQFLCCTLFICW